MGRARSSKNKSKHPKRGKKSKSATKGWIKRREIGPIQRVDSHVELEQENVDPNTSDAASSSSSSSFQLAHKLATRVPQWCEKQYKNKSHDNPPKGVVGIMSTPEYNRIQSHVLHIESEEKVQSNMTGNRIVEIEYFTSKLLDTQYSHNRVCTFGRLSIKEEIRRGLGLISCIVLECSNCPQNFKVFTENPKIQPSTINTGAVWGTYASGSTFHHLNEHLACIDIPNMPDRMFRAIEEDISEEWRIFMWQSMEAAGKREREHAITENQLCEDGIPWITVYLDGSWSKRSYGHTYDALSGMVGIIGKFTEEVLFIGVKNKFCSICTRAKNKGVEAAPHICFKNWQGSAAAMEAQIVTEGFQCSEEMHGLRYGKFIADGDSSTFARIKKDVSYGSFVKKVECTNHALKNYTKNLYKLKNDKNINLAGRKLLKVHKIKILGSKAKSLIYHFANQTNEGSISELKKCLENSVHHVFGDHSKCIEDVCTSVGQDTVNELDALKRTTMYNHINGALNLLIRKVHLLIDNENNTRVERLMNIVARFNLGKRLNLIQRGSYQARVHLSGLRYNHGFDWHLIPWKNYTKRSPGKYFMLFIDSNKRKKESKVRKNLFKQLLPQEAQEAFEARGNKPKQCHKDPDYGLHAEQPEEDEKCISEEVDRLLRNMQVEKGDIVKIADDTVGQFANDRYLSYKKYRLTASNFGRVIKRRPQTSCHNIVKQCLGKNYFYSEACEYGKTKESVAISLFEEATNLEVKKTGLWIDSEHGYLAASPDGLVGYSSIIEVKCLYSAKSIEDKCLKDIVLTKKGSCLEIKDDTVQLKRSHVYFYQIQGQLNITNRDMCYFVVYINDIIPIFIQRILKDELLWRKEMLPTLDFFYKYCIAPEAIRNRIGRNLQCIDPPYILKAIQEYEAKKASQEMQSLCE